MFSKFLVHLTDQLEVILGMRNLTTPGKKLRLLVGPFGNPASYESDAKNFIDKIETVISINDRSNILDVGCGSGRLIFELASRKPGCKYFGFDIIQELICWGKAASENLPVKPSFEHADIFNSLYNPKGKIDGSNYKFPYTSQYFDLVIIQSVFTHMKYNDIKNYLLEVNRVLKPNGRAIVTFFLMNKKSIAGIRRKQTAFTFDYKSGNEYYNDFAHPEAAVAYDQQVILSLIKESNLLIDNNVIHYGYWYGKNNFVYQDLLVLRKKK